MLECLQSFIIMISCCTTAKSSPGGSTRSPPIATTLYVRWGGERRCGMDGATYEQRGEELTRLQFDDFDGSQLSCVDITSLKEGRREGRSERPAAFFILQRQRAAPPADRRTHPHFMHRRGEVDHQKHFRF